MPSLGQMAVYVWPGRVYERPMPNLIRTRSWMSFDAQKHKCCALCTPAWLTGWALLPSKSRTAVGQVEYDMLSRE